LRSLITVVVVYAVGRRLWVERAKLVDYRAGMTVEWLVAGGVIYLVGLTHAGLFWGLTMRDQGVRPPWISVLAAYYAGHLGKYVPGKGLAILIRAGMTRDAGVPLVTGAVTSTQETLLMMATGAAVAAVTMPTMELPHRGSLQLLALAVSAGLGLAVSPPAIEWLGRYTARSMDGGEPSGGTQIVRWRTLAIGIGATAMSWLMMGCSLGAVLQSIGAGRELGDRIGYIGAVVLLTAATALAGVGGFLSLVPGGLGSREWILMHALGPSMGDERAALVAVALRCVWIVAEIMAFLLFMLLNWRCRKRSSRELKIHSFKGEK
jgi:hypothetical protein